MSDSATAIQLEAYRDTWSDDDTHANFKSEVAVYTTHDPLPTLRNLSADTGVPLGAIVRYVLVKYATSGADALLSMTPIVFTQMKDHIAAAEAADTDAARIEAYGKLKNMIAWLAWAERPPSEYRRSEP
jgi:hypothetical protein